MSDTPKHWKKYLDSLEEDYQKALDKWAEEAVEEVEEYQARPWYQKIMHSEDDIKMWHEWEKPCRSFYEPSIVGYYNWDVNRKKKNART